MALPTGQQFHLCRHCPSRPAGLMSLERDLKWGSSEARLPSWESQQAVIATAGSCGRSRRFQGAAGMAMERVCSPEDTEVGRPPTRSSFAAFRGRAPSTFCGLPRDRWRRAPQPQWRNRQPAHAPWFPPCPRSCRTISPRTPQELCLGGNKAGVDHRGGIRMEGRHPPAHRHPHPTSSEPVGACMVCKQSG